MNRSGSRNYKTHSHGEVVGATLPWLAVLLTFLVLVTYIEDISLALPNALF